MRGCSHSAPPTLAAQPEKLELESASDLGCCTINAPPVDPPTPPEPRAAEPAIEPLNASPKSTTASTPLKTALPPPAPASEPTDSELVHCAAELPVAD